ncbi:MAG TPA: hypothetical protein VFY67_15480 [Pyrinomonadaceae bacterium]|nr:hypothetical protein [Pyrinomonadaceae bacterium]
MKVATHKNHAPFEFILDELLPLRPVVKQMFGFTYVSVGDKLMLLLRNRTNQPHFNGVWLATTEEHFESLQKEFPVSPAWLVDFAKKQWLLIPISAEELEEYSLKACELILNGDVRVGRLSNPKSAGRQKKKGSATMDDETFSLFRSRNKPKEPA